MSNDFDHLLLLLLLLLLLSQTQQTIPFTRTAVNNSVEFVMSLLLPLYQLAAFIR